MSTRGAREYMVHVADRKGRDVTLHGSLVLDYGPQIFVPPVPIVFSIYFINVLLKDYSRPNHCY